MRASGVSTSDSFWKAGHLPTLVGSFVYFDASFMIWVLLGALGNHVAGDLGLSVQQKGFMTAIPLLAGSGLRLILGVLADEIGPKRTGLIGMSLTLLPLLGGWLWADSLGKVFVIGLLLGVAGASFAVALPMASRWYPPHHQGLAMGIAGAGNSGTLLATLFAPRLAEAFGWHAVFGLAIIPLIAAMLVFGLLAKDPPTTQPAALQRRKFAEYRSLLQEPDTYRFCLFYAVTFGGFAGLVSFMPIFLRDQYGVSMVGAGDLTSVCVLAGSGMRPLGGWFADKLGGIRVLLGLYVMITVLLLAIAQLPSLTTVSLFLLLVLGMMGLGNGAVFQLVPLRFEGSVGAVTGLIGAGGGLGGFLLPVVLGSFKQHYASFAPGFSVFALFAIAALINVWVGRRKWVGFWLGEGGLAMEKVSSIAALPLPETVASATPPARERLVVVGNGMAGARFVEELLVRKGRERLDIVMFGDEPYGNYNRILLSSVLAGTHDAKEIFMNPLQWYEENGIQLHAGVRVESIDRAKKLVHGAGGIRERYDYLVFATGAKPFVPPIQGIVGEANRFRDGVFLFRTLDDSLQIMKHAEKARKAVVIGGGLLGLEAARGLLNRGLEVHVVELMPHPMAVQLDPPAGSVLRATLEGMGIRFHLGKSVTAARGNGHIDGVVFSDGADESCDMLILSAGIRPNVDVAKQAGLQVERGIVVGDDLRCVNDRSIFAIGECAQHRGQTYGLVAPCWDQARVLAERLSGTNLAAIYEGSSISTRLKIMGVDLVVLGKKEPADDKDEVVTYTDSRQGVYKKVIVREGRLAGAILLGDGTTAPRLLQLFHRNETVPANRAELLFPLAVENHQTNVADAPDSLQVCNCNGVSKGQIVESIQAGCRTLKSLCESTRAGTGCGSCKSLVKAILEAASDGAPVEDPSIHYYVPGVPFSKPELVAKIKELRLRSVSAVFGALAGGKEDPKSKIGLASLLKTIWGAEYDDERDARFINDRVHANIQKDGTFSVVPRIYGGVTTPQQLRTIADVAEKYQVPMVKITGGQRIDLLGVRKEQLPAIWKDLGIPSGHAYTKAVRTVKTCIGTDFCRYGVGDSTSLGIKIEKRFQGMEAPHKIKMAASGCPRNCAESMVKDVGVVAIEGGRWEVYVGGAAGSRVRKGDILCTADTHEDVLLYVGRFIQYYRENAKYLERTYDFVERVGIEKLRRLLVEDAEGICARLDAEIERAVAAYRDPWREEANSPFHPLQFQSVAPAELVEVGGAR